MCPSRVETTTCHLSDGPQVRLKKKRKAILVDLPSHLKMAQLRYPTKLPNKWVKRDALKKVSEEKVQAILRAGERRPDEVNKSLKEVLPKILRQDNITDQSRSDRRCTISNTEFQLRGALSNQFTSPTGEQNENPSFFHDTVKACLLAQSKLFDLLKLDLKLGDEFTWNDGILHKKGKSLATEEFCNTIDEVTLAFLEEVKVTDDKSATTKQNRGEELNPMIACVEEIVINQAVAASVLEVDILSDDGYTIWKKHLNEHASFTALWVVMEEVKR